MRNFLGAMPDYDPDGFGGRPSYLIPATGYSPAFSAAPVVAPLEQSNIGNLDLPQVGFQPFGTDPQLRVPMQGSEPGLRFPAPSTTGLGGAQLGGSGGMDLLGTGTKLMDSSKPKEQAFEPLGLLMPQSRADFNSLYANYLKTMGLLA